MCHVWIVSKRQKMNCMELKWTNIYRRYFFFFLVSVLSTFIHPTSFVVYLLSMRSQINAPLMGCKIEHRMTIRKSVQLQTLATDSVPIHSISWMTYIKIPFEMSLFHFFKFSFWTLNTKINHMLDGSTRSSLIAHSMYEEYDACANS